MFQANRRFFHFVPRLVLFHQLPLLASFHIRAAGPVGRGSGGGSGAVCGGFRATLAVIF
ncbi:hypothetical protein DPMN_075459 [Dreissena polymorpha]|uniref:Uncharacterized protein n=1 Tax=Dreissena polymorpha TaxID=45954 RepID=A0A9D3YJL0_DREPO|nr:hypothetical protein DPMN_075459 [Dreissena polymorpha]